MTGPVFVLTVLTLATLGIVKQTELCCVGQGGQGKQALSLLGLFLRGDLCKCKQCLKDKKMISYKFLTCTLNTSALVD
jgi:hypothetical protein